MGLNQLRKPASVLFKRAAATAVSKKIPSVKMYIAEERGSPYAPDYRVYFSE